MGENEWLNGYLKAILDIGAATSESSNHHGIKSQIDKEMLFSPTKYFVEEVINRSDEADLHRTWIKVVATRNSRERSNRLENMCWRVWHLARKKKQIACDDAQKLVKRRLEREKAAEDLSDLSEGEKDKSEPNQTDFFTDISKINSDNQTWWSDDKSRQLYIVLISLHGLVRGENMELGRDCDTGGQVKYVVELARALANMNGVHRVDLLTRQITSPEVDSSYAEPIEMLSCPSDGSGSCGAYIIRIPCGPHDKYIPKESLWPYLAEFVDGALGHIVNMARALGEQVNGGGKPAWPYVIHGHYADAGEVAAHLSGVLNVPMVLTGHSLGRNKLEQLLKQGRLSRDEINTTFNIMRRIEAEELGLDSAEMVVTSTRQEIEEQWGLYDGFDTHLERKLRIRRRRGVTCLGRYMPRMVVIPPGMELTTVTTQDPSEGNGDLRSLISTTRTQTRPIPPIWFEIMRFLTNPHKPMILALSHPDPKKNITTLIKAFGECQPLRELANLTLILGNRDDIEEMSNNSSVVLTTVLKLIDKYDLYGQVAYPKHHRQLEVPEIYRLAAETKGVFINPALVEPFGLTLIEAAAYGLPIVATKHGGPVDILKALNNGVLVDPYDQKATSDALLKLVADKNLWHECRKNGLKNIQRFSWTEHCRNYLAYVEQCKNYHLTSHLSVMPVSPEPLSESLRGVEDLSLKFSMEVDFKVKEVDAPNKHELAEILIQKPISKGKPINIYCPGRRESLYVLAADCYNRNGTPNEALPLVIQNVIQAAGSESGQIGFVLLSGLSLTEIKEALKSCQVKLEDFDALICKSGSEMYYPWRDLVIDEDYEAHIEYRWPGENVKSIVIRLATKEDGSENHVMQQITECSSRCYSYSIKRGAKTQNVDDLKQRLRMRGLRCRLVHTHAATRLNVIPLFASRDQALRYLSVKWGIELSKIIVFVGERGDTDFESLLGGLHKTIILRGCVAYGSEDKYKKEDKAPEDSTNILLAEGFEAHEISEVLASSGLITF